jgi:hypothetical protein
VTRAKQRLYLTVPLLGKQFGQEVALIRSKFLKKIMPLATERPGTLVEESMVSPGANIRYMNLTGHDGEMGW